MRRLEPSRFRGRVMTRRVLVSAIAASVAASGAAVAAVGPGGGSPPPGITVTAAGDSASVTLSCPASPPGATRADCLGRIRFTALLRGTGKTLTVVTTPPGRTVAVGHAPYLVAPGTSATVPVTLGPRGRHLLARFYTLPTTLSLAGAIQAETRPVTFAYGRMNPRFTYLWRFTPSYDQIQLLNVVDYPAGARVLVLCHGGGCPFHRQPVPAADTATPVTRSLARAHLRRGAELSFAVHAPNDVASVATFKVVPGGPPRIQLACLPPGVSAPTKCA